MSISTREKSAAKQNLGLSIPWIQFPIQFLRMIVSVIDQNILRRNKNVAEWKKIVNFILILKWKNHKNLGEFSMSHFILSFSANNALYIIHMNLLIRRHRFGPFIWISLIQVENVSTALSKCLSLPQRTYSSTTHLPRI